MDLPPGQLVRHVVVAVNDDKSITTCKFTAMVNNDERIAPVGGCQYVDESYGLGYITNEKHLQYLLKKYCIDYVIHGYDLCIFVHEMDA
ncbi:Ethanolamine-phosphate cytidylyltransferase [Phytophthora megakarya]|uniref:Ethanolamine-phosphate cytidylyltransferase n=1 Tax=Phytophthora megakarya TaxID=4795 RepID=A0A225UQZ4_9STRA|nr:Ethanolamine-phosphate cytidylyltransferase [Phytophthora megakarya]